MQESIEKAIAMITENKLYMSIIIIAIGIIVYKIIEKTINRLLEKDTKNQRLDKKGRTIFKLFSNIVKYIIMIIVGVLILKIHGVNVNSFVAGLGLVSVIVGLAIQDPLKDLISGINIISDDYFALGDVVQIDNIEGKVIHLGARTTKLKDVKTENIYVVANRTISKAVKSSNKLYVGIALSYEDKTLKVEEILRKIAQKIEKLENVSEAKYIGIDEFADYSIKFKFEIVCKPEYKLNVKREANRIIKIELDKQGIEIPYPQLTLHRGDE